jgi:primosomal replication protein N
VDATPAVRAWTITCSPGTVTLGSVADSWVLQSSPSTNHRTDSVLKVDSKKSSNNARALVRFDLPAIPAGCQVTGASLRLYAGSATTGRTLSALRVTANWTESGVTWSNQPATTNTAAASVTSGSGWRQWNVLTQVQTMYTGSNYGFLIRDASESNSSGKEQQLHSREKSPDRPPELVITFG